MNKIILLIITYILYKIGFIGKLLNVSLPFLYAFVLAYIFYPIYKWLNRYIPKYLSVLIIILLIVFIIILLIFLLPKSLNEINYLYKVIINYFTNLSVKYNINIDSVLLKINGLINYNYLFRYITKSISYIYSFLLTFIIFIYILIDIDKIKEYIYNINPKLSNYLDYLNNDIGKYIGSLIKISIVTFFEYSLVFFIIGHKNFILVGVIAGILNMIPYIGGIITVFLTILLEPTKIIIISITYLFLGLIDGYLIAPYIYGKYNKINPIFGLFAISVGGIFGITGIILSFPILIVLKSTINYVKEFVM